MFERLEKRGSGNFTTLPSFAELDSRKAERKRCVGASAGRGNTRAGRVLPEGGERSGNQPATHERAAASSEPPRQRLRRSNAHRIASGLRPVRIRRARLATSRPVPSRPVRLRCITSPLFAVRSQLPYASCLLSSVGAGLPQLYCASLSFASQVLLFCSKYIEGSPVPRKRRWPALLLRSLPCGGLPPEPR